MRDVQQQEQDAHALRYDVAAKEEGFQKQDLEGKVAKEARTQSFIENERGEKGKFEGGKEEGALCNGRQRGGENSNSFEHKVSF